jgi:5-formyltetrahydrofolate cyclo-ligase
MACSSSSKAALRLQFKRQRLSAQEQVGAAIVQSALEHLPQAAAATGHIGIYWPLPGETDLRAVAELPPLAGRLALPRISQGTLEYLPWSPGSPLEPDDTGIPAPSGGAVLGAEQMACLLVPALALDRKGFRLGYGGGWFDRLRAAPCWRAVPALAVVPCACLVEQLPRDPWDVPFSGWLNEEGLHWITP